MRHIDKMLAVLRSKYEGEGNLDFRHCVEDIAGYIDTLEAENEALQRKVALLEDIKPCDGKGQCHGLGVEDENQKIYDALDALNAPDAEEEDD